MERAEEREGGFAVVIGQADFGWMQEASLALALGLRGPSMAED